MSKNSPLLVADNLSKTYTLWDRPMDRLFAIALSGFGKKTFFLPPLQKMFHKWANRRAKVIEALKPLSFSIKQGESLGIIGRNGSGKSTLLQILAGTLNPSSGYVIRNGRITALLELGSGFNLEFTGRENVIMQAALYGFTEAQIKSLMPEVESFAEIGDFIDQPVKSYSSGMLVRLAFAVQTVVDPDVFIVDEALAVGDVFFQSRCARWFRRKLEEGMSLILVSHDLPSIRALCKETIVLDSGKNAFFGPSDEAVSIYHKLHESRAMAAKRQLASSNGNLVSSEEWTPRNWSSTDEIGSREAEIIHCRLVNKRNEITDMFDVREPIVIKLRVKAHQDIGEAHLGFQIVDRHARALYGINSRTREDLTGGLSQGEEGVFEIELQGLLGSGDFLIDAAIVAGDRGDGAPSHHYHRIGGIAKFSVKHPTLKPDFLGMANLNATFKWQSLTHSPSNINR